MINNLKVKFVYDWENNRSTVATYQDDDGSHRSTKINGFQHLDVVKQSIISFRRRIEAQNYVN